MKRQGLTAVIWSTDENLRVHIHSVTLGGYLDSE